MKNLVQGSHVGTAIRYLFIYFYQHFTQILYLSGLDSYRNGKKSPQSTKAEFGLSYSTTVCCTYFCYNPELVYLFITNNFIFSLGKLNDAESVYRNAKKEKSVNSKGWLARLLTGLLLAGADHFITE